MNFFQQSINIESLDYKIFLSMHTISEEKLNEWNNLGLIPGPEESEDKFLERANYCLTLKKHLKERLGNEVPFATEAPARYQGLEEALLKTKKHYDIIPEWVPLFYSNYKLTPWHGGCAWIFQVTENAPKAALLQLRKAFQSSKHYLSIYHRDELVAHELSHVGRIAFEEPKFEEFLAYRSSGSLLRRWLGPIVQSALESLIFVLALILIFLLDIFLISIGNEELFLKAMWIKVIPLGMLVFALGRLSWRHYRFNNCFKHLLRILGSKKATNAVMYRLTDQEIIDFSRKDSMAVKEYINKHRERSLRWHLISKAYFDGNR